MDQTTTPDERALDGTRGSPAARNAIARPAPCLGLTLFRWMIVALGIASAQADLESINVDIEAGRKEGPPLETQRKPAAETQRRPAAKKASGRAAADAGGETGEIHRCHLHERRNSCSNARFAGQALTTDSWCAARLDRRPNYDYAYDRLDLKRVLAREKVDGTARQPRPPARQDIAKPSPTAVDEPGRRYSDLLRARTAGP